MSNDLLPRLTSSDEDIRETAYEDLNSHIDDRAAELLLSIASGDWPEDIRARAIVAFGPVIEECGLDYCDEVDFFDDPELLPSVSRRQFGTIVKRLRSLYEDEGQPLLIRRRAFENLVRDPQPWMTKEVPRLAASDEIDWRVTGVFAMGHMKGFGKEIVAALDDDSPQIVFEAIRAAGMQQLRRAASRVRKFATSAADRELHLEAIAQLPFVDDDSLELLEKLSRSRDREVASAAKDAILALHEKWATDEAIAEAELEDDQEDDDDLLFAEQARFRANVPEVDAILDKLRSEEPKVLLEGVAEAVEKREVITPHLLQMIEGLTNENVGDMAATLALYLLAQFRETRALEPILRYFKNAGPDSHDDFGDVVTEDLPAILLSVSGSQIERLRELVEAKDADEWSRSSALEALVRGVAFGLTPREELVGYLRELVEGRLEREPSHVWDTVAAAVAALGAAELLDEVEAAFDEGLAADGMVTLDEFREDVSRGADDALALYRRYSHPPFIDDTAHSIRWWSFFGATHHGSVRHGRDDDLPPPRVPEAKPKVGRNEPCPCGSGKKYKKCCGA